MSSRAATTSTTAVVIGGSIAGLCAARALCKHVDRVVVIEADRIEDSTPSGRKGVPQSRYAHALLQGGERALERLFPGFGARLLSLGALRFDMGERFAFLRAEGWTPAFATGMSTYWCSRAVTERAVRELCGEQVGAEVLHGCRVTALCTSPADGARPPRVTGVELRRPDGTTERLDAQLVVDAAGRGSQSLRWLEQLGVAEVQEEKVDAHVAYAGRWYQAPKPADRPASWWWNGLWIDPVAGSSPFFSVLIPAEHGRWFGGMACYGPWDVPHDEASFLRELRAQRTPLLAQALALATPESDVLVTRSTVNHFRHFERGDTRVAGLLALGDAVCSFNPAYGQGMSVAAQSALALEAVLKELGARHPELERRFFAAQAQLSQLPWTLATGADLQFETTDGERPRLGRVLSPYFGALMRCANVTPEVMRRVLPVFHLNAGMQRLVQPAVVAEVLRYALKQRLRRVAPLPMEAPLPPASIGRPN
jgi:2-polyprenyl-6-methoxyphenol hydroxylase-like FAD-dependent oxidoreductase